MTLKINQAIVGYSVRSTSGDTGTNQKNTPLLKSAPVMDVMHEEIARPDELKGYTYKIKTPMSSHAMYITINNILLNDGTEHKQEYPFEVFINSKNMEQFQWILALTRVISAVFRKGGDSVFLIRELKEVFDPQGGYFKKGSRQFMPSLVAEIGHVLETHMKKIGLIKKEELSQEHKMLLASRRASFDASTNSKNDASEDTDSYPAGAKLCQQCHVAAMMMLDGCMTCLACGDSKCN